MATASKAVLQKQLEELAPGQTLTYRMPGIKGLFPDRFMMVELNPEHPKKGEKYVLTQDESADGKPAGETIHIWAFNKATVGAKWLEERFCNELSS